VAVASRKEFGCHSNIGDGVSERSDVLDLGDELVNLRRRFPKGNGQNTTPKLDVIDGKSLEVSDGFEIAIILGERLVIFQANLVPGVKEGLGESREIGESVVGIQERGSRECTGTVERDGPGTLRGEVGSAGVIDFLCLPVQIPPVFNFSKVKGGNARDHVFESLGGYAPDDTVRTSSLKECQDRKIFEYRNKKSLTPRRAKNKSGFSVVDALTNLPVVVMTSKERT
jgi:hypothetical protein